MYGQHLKKNVDILPAGLLFTRKEPICDQLIKLIKSDKSEQIWFVWVRLKRQRSNSLAITI